MAKRHTAAELTAELARAEADARNWRHVAQSMIARKAPEAAIKLTVDGAVSHAALYLKAPGGREYACGGTVLLRSGDCASVYSWDEMSRQDPEGISAWGQLARALREAEAVYRATVPA